MAALTPDDYFEAALDVIAREGVGAVTIAKLCARLDVTIGSFYHHFKGSQQFLAAFFVWWETTQGSALADQARLEPDPVARLRLLKKLSAGIAHDAEAAIRTWSTSHPDAAAAQSRVDEARIEVVHDTLRQLGHPSPRARTLAVMAVGVLVGTQQMGQSDDANLMRKVLDELEIWLSGLAASA